jgi:3-hydroxyacyl-CoA dehydrogenase
MTQSLNAPAAPVAEISAYIAGATRQAWEVKGLPVDAAILPVGRVGVIGAGTMGGGIAMNFANVGIPVRIVEAKQDNLDRGLGVIRRNYENSAAKGRFAPEEVGVRMGLLSGSMALEDLSDCDLIIEAVFEDMEIKKSVFRRLDDIARPGAILATNTSYLNVDEIAAVTRRPEDVIGLHFFSPANVMKLLEIVRGAKTSDSVIATSMDLARRIQKIAVLVGVCHGFVGNRMLAKRQSAALSLVYQGVMPWKIDAALNAFGFKMGPFQMSDLAGLDIGWQPGARTQNPLRDRLCEMGRRGQKTGAGFYDYDAERRGSPSPAVEAVISEIVAEKGLPKRDPSDEEIVEECIFPMINEGAKILEEGMAQRASDIDVVWLNGYGWPSDKGGPMFLGDHVGLGRVLAKIETMDPAVYAPSSLLRRLAADGGRFSDL